MIITFVSNFLNPHILPICLELARRKNIDFNFIALQELSLARSSMKFSDYNDKYDFVVKSYLSEDEYCRAIEIICKSEVVILADAPFHFTKMCIDNCSVVFRSSERFFKRGTIIKFWPKSFLEKRRHIIKFRNSQLYYLCSSAYLAYDLKQIGFPTNKCFKWGYFAELPNASWNEIAEIKANNSIIQLLWVGKMLPRCKCPMLCIELAKYLKRRGYEFRITIIGEGPQEELVKSNIKSNNLEQEVQVLSFVTPEEVKAYMCKSDIYLFTSGYLEGWGAVLNEAMGGGCAVVACTAAGATPYLIQNKINGLTYDFNDVRVFINNVESLITDKEYRKILGRAAYDTIHETWGVKTAADNLLILIDAILKHEEPHIKSGPGSRAHVIKDNNFWGILKKSQF